MLLNVSTSSTLAAKLLVADTFWKRLIGLLGKTDMPSGAALLISPCNSVHTMFMHFPIDILFINRDFIVVKIVRDLKPWRTAACSKAYSVIEAAAGTVSRTGTKEGDRLLVSREP